jgi:hypothetical protein
MISGFLFMKVPVCAGLLRFGLLVGSGNGRERVLGEDTLTGMNPL